jgi:hypothetical protein
MFQTTTKLGHRPMMSGAAWSPMIRTAETGAWAAMVGATMVAFTAGHTAMIVAAMLRRAARTRLRSALTLEFTQLTHGVIQFALQVGKPPF